MTNWNAYHFVGDTLRDGRPVPPDGETLIHDGNLDLCRSGLHFSRTPFQALEYAPGTTLCRVHVGGKIIEPDGENKGVCAERTIIARIDAEGVLREFARLCALDAIDLWDAPEVVRKYLTTGDENLRDAAWAAWDAAWAASNAAWAARDAAWAASNAAWAARDAAWAAIDAAWAARAVARDAEMAAQNDRLTEMVNAAFDEAPQ